MTATNAQLDLRAYAPGDEAAIGSLFAAAFERELPRAFWEWRYRANPAGGPWIELAWDGDVLAAHYAISSAVLQIEGRDVPAALSMTTMTHPGYRGRGLFPALAQRLYERFSKSGGDVVYGFPNTNSHRGFVRDLGWHDLTEIPTLHTSLRTARMPRAAAGQIAIATAFDERFDRLWMRLAPSHDVWLRRDAAWLAWRFGACPLHAYTLAAWNDGDDVRGWAVVKRFGDGGLDLVDLVAEDTAVATDLAGWALLYAQAEGCIGITAWCPLYAGWRPALESCGFQPAAPVTYMGARALSATGSAVAQARRWGFSMADSDVY